MVHSIFLNSGFFSPWVSAGGLVLWVIAMWPWVFNFIRQGQPGFCFPAIPSLKLQIDAIKHDMCLGAGLLSRVWGLGTLGIVFFWLALRTLTFWASV